MKFEGKTEQDLLFSIAQTILQREGYIADESIIELEINLGTSSNPRVSKAVNTAGLILDEIESIIAAK